MIWLWIILGIVCIITVVAIFTPSEDPWNSDKVQYIPPYNNIWYNKWYSLLMTEKETDMKKVDLDKALEVVDGMKAICEDGKKEVRSLVYAIMGKDEPEEIKLFNSTRSNMFIEEMGQYCIKQGTALGLEDNLKHICQIEDGVLVLNNSFVNTPSILTDSKGRILVKEGTILGNE